MNKIQTLWIGVLRNRPDAGDLKVRVDTTARYSQEYTTVNLLVRHRHRDITVVSQVPI